MGLSIKNDEIEQLVRTLAARRGVGLSAAVRLAVSNELARDDIVSATEKERKLAAIREIQDRVAARGGLPSMKDMDDWLYDDYGAPH